MGLANSKQEAFWEACGFGHKERVKKFLEEGVDVNWVSYTHDSCAIHVASQGKVEIVDMLIKANCDVNVKDERGCLALHHAAMNGYADIMKMLIEAGSEIDTQDKNGWTPLHSAAYWSHIDAVNVLIEKGCDVKLKNKDERTALHEATRSPEFSREDGLNHIITALVEAGCEIDQYSKDEFEGEFTPLMFAAYHGHPGVIKSLLEEDCDIYAQGTRKWTALHWAANRGHPKCVEILLAAGANPNTLGERGESALDKANSAQVKLLLEEAMTEARDSVSVLTPIDERDAVLWPDSLNAFVKSKDDLDEPVDEVEQTIDKNDNDDIVRHSEPDRTIHSDETANDECAKIVNGGDHDTIEDENNRNNLEDSSHADFETVNKNVPAGDSIMVENLNKSSIESKNTESTLSEKTDICN
ncbi:unnamed protein product [Owenia fusiformis]|uniref:Uncharacterized protein n=1 Tax=Owenia fusiformis TaxID=6347 RepID=A0A8J1U7Q6_OWEFU|nr:unnamed protein product [Owenia fusiformis]